MGMKLSKRQKDVLLTIVELYSMSTKPVSSDDVIRNSGIQASSATIRNDMQKLQHLSYIYQQHTSGGRIPTDKALKLYFEIIEEAYGEEQNYLEMPRDYKFYDLNIMFENLSEIISSTLDGLVIFEYPDPKYIYVTRAVVTPLTEYHYVVILLTNLGMTISRTVESYGLPAAKELENMLNDGLAGKSLFDIIYASKTQKLKTEDIRLTNMFNLIEILLNEFSRNKYLIKGLEKIISKFKPNIESVDSLTKIIENDNIKDEIFSNIDYSHDLNVFFGSELNTKSLKNFAFFSTSYSLGSNPIGRMLFITDKFCNYEKIYKIIKEYNSRFSEIISKNL